MIGVQSSPRGLIVRTPYNPAFVAALKAQVPTAGRAWDNDSKTWIVAHPYATVLASVMQQFYPGVKVPAAQAVVPQTELRLLDVRYVGVTKDRGGDTRTAFGYCAGTWSVIFPEAELRRWFGMDAELDNGRAPEAATLYQVLNVAKGATADEIKRGYRRMARQWHPDVCHEPDAAAQFRRIQEAYEALSDANKRARYDAGLIMQGMTTARAQYDGGARLAAQSGYRPPLRCGYILAEGCEQLGRFLVSKILAWEDITDSAGRTLVTSWPAGADKFVEVWS